MVRLSMHEIRRAEVQHLRAEGRAFSWVNLFDANGNEVALSVTAAQAEAVAAAFAPKVNEAGIPVFEKPAPACDRCGEMGDIRAIRQPYGPADHVCAACFAQADAENSFTDLKEAI